ncbi:MAG: mechanosensitive ion channel family protein [Ignavibacteria bacterium]|nr:mechanosensitive ion channel family protein [Ignavibacteria bacterium]
MKLLLLIQLILQVQIINQDTLNTQNLIKDSVQFKSVIETVKVIITPQVEKEKTNPVVNRNYNELFSETSSLGLRILFSIILIFTVIYLSQRVNTFLNKNDLSNRLRNPELIKLLTNFFIWILALIIIYLIFDNSPLILLLLALLISIIFLISTVDVMKNLVGGILLFIEKPFEYGDWIKIDDYTGRVYHKNFLTTEIITEDDALIKIPNQNFITKTFENLNVISKNKQVSFIVEVPPHSEISKIKSSLFEITSLSIFNSINKPVEIIYKGINDRGKMEFQIKAYVFDARYESEFKSDVQERIAEIFGIN